MAIVTFADIKKFLDLTDSAITDYPGLEGILDSMQPEFEEFCSRLFDIEERTETERVSDIDKVIFPVFGVPIDTVAEVLVNAVALVVSDDFTIFDTYIELEEPLEKGDLLSIRYTGGIIDNTDAPSLLATLPKELNFAAVRQISFEYQNRERIGVTQTTLDDDTQKIPETDLLNYTIRILNQFINYRMKL